MFAGPILTHCYTLDQIEDCMRRGAYTALKVVTGWGVASGWSKTAMSRASALAEQLIVRTVAGDPSYRNGAQRYPTARQVVNEIAPWYAVRPKLIIEIGNEPNINPEWTEQYAWEYRWHLEQAIKACRAAFPDANLIAPAPILDADKRPDRWLALCVDRMRLCDYIGLHAYEYTAFAKIDQHGTTGHLNAAQKLYNQHFGDRPWILTEFGINDREIAPILKGRRYAQLLPTLPRQIIGALYYHFCADAVVQPEYHIWPLGDIGFREARI